jgi:hypothetical protein
MADIVHLSVHCLWAAVAAYALTVCRAWLGSRMDRDVLANAISTVKRVEHYVQGWLEAAGKEHQETTKTVLWLKNELEKLRAVPRTPRL